MLFNSFEFQINFFAPPYWVRSSGSSIAIDAWQSCFECFTENSIKEQKAVYCLQISALVPKLFEFEKYIKYANEMTDASYTQPVEYINRAILANLQRRPLKKWRTVLSTGNTPMAKKNSVPMATHCFLVPPTALKLLRRIYVLLAIVANHPKS